MSDPPAPCPQRIQLKRTRGWRMPPDTLKVDRSTRWGNPYRVGMPGVPDAATAVALFREAMARETLPAEPFAPASVRAALRGKHLACWCRPGEPCHADVLLEVANG